MRVFFLFSFFKKREKIKETCRWFLVEEKKEKIKRTIDNKREEMNKYGEEESSFFVLIYQRLDFYV